VTYTLLHECCVAALETAGLDPFCGFYHDERSGRASLAVDLMEEFRPVIADAVAMRLVMKGMAEPAWFRPGPRGGVYLTPEGWRRVATQFGRRIRTLVTPPGLTRRISYQKVLEAQARKLARVVQGTAETYEPFETR
jgi:CRISPR-associated protein Cas1